MMRQKDINVKEYLEESTSPEIDITSLTNLISETDIVIEIITLDQPN